MPRITPPIVGQRPAVKAVAQGAENGSTWGRVVAVHGSVVDLRFPTGALPAINEAVTIAWDLGRPLIAEVHQHLDDFTVRAVALENTAGLTRGTATRATGTAIRVPVGEGGARAAPQCHW